MDLNSRPCERCKTVVPVSKLHIYPKEKGKTWLICDGCVEKAKKDNNEPIYARKEERSTIHPEEREVRDKYLCTRCNYPFRMSVDKKVVCPYCGKGDRIRSS